MFIKEAARYFGNLVEGMNRRSFCLDVDSGLQSRSLSIFIRATF
jgi:hypothetical protein